MSGTTADVARSGARIALAGDSGCPHRLLTVFAEQDCEALARMRGYFAHSPPSEPSFAPFKDGEPVHFLPRQIIERRDADAARVPADLRSGFD
ncbi:BrxA/BrxB family bacilliredoxin [Streptomyces malaysiense]|uniref:BrxA/BrxB family bacilliredoxin n=1 Tax=Streptomyces malaysiense TaxID=1428626 RepID=UPI0023E44969|nr:BrxA/BrxB family bacilliredoxin [Streptomyces malaysiense]